MRKLETQDVPVPVPGGGRCVAHLMVGLHLRVVAWAGNIDGVKPDHYLPGFLTTGQRYRLPSKNKRAGTLMELLLYSMMMASHAINPFLPEQVFDFTDYPKTKIHLVVLLRLIEVTVLMISNIRLVTAALLSLPLVVLIGKLAVYNLSDRILTDVVLKRHAIPGFQQNKNPQ
ncbi:hypothetical protein TRIUR3_26881 [Triticum urartu]|uniref:Uncharacterized protein n=1 Tax=Triticum urartu TaxID=4572 RepID=M7Z7W0_TRIUA|nr:hypothetical protein TRIUR3_26881 [Triticum urartu]